MLRGDARRRFQQKRLAMARLATLQKGQWDQFDRTLNATDLTAEEVIKLNKHPDVLKLMLATMRDQPVFRLIHGVFNKQDDVLASFKARCAAKGIPFTYFSWISSETPPDFTDDEEVVVVLDATLATLRYTFEFAWQWTVDEQEYEWRDEDMVSDSKKLRLLSDDREDDADGDGIEFRPWTLAWRRIKLNTNIGKKPIDIRDPKSSPGCALLFMSAEHPVRIKAVDYKTRFCFQLPGLKCTVRSEGRWLSVPCVFFRCECREVRLDSIGYGSSHGSLAVPVYLE